MFDKNFFPTPEKVYYQMQVNCTGKVVYEPQAGKGDLVDLLKLNGAKEVIASELNDDLRKIIESKCKIIGTDFLKITAEEISHVDMIVMNPPFDHADKHILHAFEIAPEGCVITSLCNWKTLDNTYSRGRKTISSLIENYGLKENLKDCFSAAERKTDVEVGLVKLFKPIVSEGASFDGFFMEEEELDTRVQKEGVAKFNEVRALVKRYVGAMQIFDNIDTQMKSLAYTCSALGMDSFSLSLGYNDTVTTKEEFGKALQIKSWSHIINKMNLRKYATSQMISDINKWVETQTKVPFTERNIYHMLDMIFQTRQQNFDRALVNAIDKFTRHTKENRYGVEGWATNEGHLLNRKFIVNNIGEVCRFSEYRGVEIGGLQSRSKAEYLDDLYKVLCNMEGETYNHNYSFSYKKNWDDVVKDRYDKDEPSRYFQTNTWYKFNPFFEFKVFKKGTIHLRFKNIDVWYRLNQAYGKQKGFVLPETIKKKTK